MKNRKKLEETISSIKYEYIIESMEYSEKKATREWIRLASKVAAILFLVAFAGTASAIAASQIYKMKETKLGEDVIYIGEFDKPVDIDDESVHRVGSGTPISVSNKDSNANELWLEKYIETYENGDIITKYSFENYDNAIRFFELDSNFIKLPGRIESVTASDLNKADIIKNNETVHTYDLRSTTITSDWQFETGSYHLIEHYVVGAVATNAYIARNLYEAENERTYVSKNGIEFTLVDGYESEYKDNKITMVLLRSDQYFGAISFKNLKEKNIRTVLDCFNLNYTAPEYEHIYQE